MENQYEICESIKCKNLLQSAKKRLNEKSVLDQMRC